MKQLDNLRSLLLANVGTKFSDVALRTATGVTDCEPLLDLLVRDEGFSITKTQGDRSSSPMFSLQSPFPTPSFSPVLDIHTQKEVLLRDDFRCRMCGADQATHDCYEPSRLVRLHVEFPLRSEVTEHPSSSALITMCSVCRDGVAKARTRATPLLTA